MHEKLAQLRPVHTSIHENLAKLRRTPHSKHINDSREQEMSPGADLQPRRDLLHQLIHEGHVVLLEHRYGRPLLRCDPPGITQVCRTTRAAQVAPRESARLVIGTPQSPASLSGASTAPSWLALLTSHPVPRTCLPAAGLSSASRASRSSAVM